MAYPFPQHILLFVHLIPSVPYTVHVYSRQYKVRVLDMNITIIVLFVDAYYDGWPAVVMWGRRSGTNYSFVTKRERRQYIHRLTKIEFL